MNIEAIHGGPDALGVPRYDLSSNANACGPHAPTVQALRTLDARHYPDPAYTALTAQLAAWHGVAPARVVIAASGSEFIQRISVAVALQAGQGASVWLPAHAYGDYARAARAAGLARVDDAADAALLWACEPSSPLGQAQAGLTAKVAALRPGQALVLDQAYEPLRLSGAPSLDAAALDSVWRLVTPNKALGLTGVRAAYAVAPESAQAQVAALQALAPSWPVGAGGVALLTGWVQADAQAWLAQSLTTLRGWKAQQTALCASLGWAVRPGSLANFLTARPPAGDLPAALQALRAQGIKLRDCASFGLPGHVRLGVLAPLAQQALADAWRIQNKELQ